jgi:hypothetical protein
LLSYKFQIRSLQKISDHLVANEKILFQFSFLYLFIFYCLMLKITKMRLRYLCLIQYKYFDYLVEAETLCLAETHSEFI